jgi:hypothetical protein
MESRYNFTDLFTDKIPLNQREEVTINKIVIPKIQRSYAQGRKSEENIREKILADIFNSIKTQSVMELNFIYGTVIQSEDKYYFELLDGQQRITTLFLLYWYIGNRELNIHSEQMSDLQTSLMKFVYETRKTASDFCQELSKYNCIFNERPSISIKKAKWYFKSFDKDSTIEAMLIMLDAIHLKYEELIKEEADIQFYNRLANIQFYVLSLGEFGLNEELYIKMNARGLPLSPFDNFKAELIGFMKNDRANKDFYQTNVPLVNSLKDEKVPYYLNISTKLDTTWIDIFWEKEDSGFDQKYFSFFYRYFASKYIIDYAKSKSSRDMRTDSNYEFLNRASEEEQVKRYLNFHVYSDMLKNHPEYIQSLEKVLDCLKEHYVKDIKPNMNPSWDEEDWNFFDLHRFTQTKRIVFSAITEFIEAYDNFEVEIFRQWMRVVWNIVENTNIDNISAVTFTERNLSRIVRFSAKSYKEKNISLYQSLAIIQEEETSDVEEKERSRALREEITKAERIAENSSWEAVFKVAESHDFFRGMIGFFYSKGMDIAQFQHRFELIKNVFDKNGVKAEFRQDGHIFLRALISSIQSYNSLNNTNFTDEVEKDKYLKNLLASNHIVREFIRNIFDKPVIDEVKKELYRMVNRYSEIDAWSNDTNAITRVRRVHESLYRQPKLQDWIQKEKAFRVKWFGDNLFTLRPNAWYKKIMLDTERNLAIPKIVEEYGFEYCDANQEGSYNQVGYIWGNSVDLEKKYNDRLIKLRFDLASDLKVLVEYKNEEDKNQLKAQLNLANEEIADDKLTIYHYKYDGINIYNDIKEQILDSSGIFSKLTE